MVCPRFRGDSQLDSQGRFTITEYIAMFQYTQTVKVNDLIVRDDGGKYLVIEVWPNKPYGTVVANFAKLKNFPQRIGS